MDFLKKLEFFQEELFDELKERRANCVKINNVAINSNSKSSHGHFPITIILMPGESQTIEAPSLPSVLTHY